jgi:GDP-4-dehydro-6-deoxy-D-mannose reductase
MRVLITGANGFVGQHLVAALMASAEQPEIVAATLGTMEWPGVRHVSMDVTDQGQTLAVIAREQPTHLIHLAGIAALVQADRQVRKTWEVNTQGSLNVAFAIQEAAPECRMLFCSSGQVYGASFRSGRPLAEDAALEPNNVYAASKAAADLFIGQMAREGLHAIRVRPFNHTGPRQSPDYAVPGFASQIAAIERGKMAPTIRVGNLAMRRDFLDVRDVVDAYWKIILRFDDLPNGAAFNIASGGAMSMEEILRSLLAMSPAKIDVVPDPARMRPHDTPLIAGDGSAARKALGWAPRHAIADTLKSVLDYYRNL